MWLSVTFYISTPVPFHLLGAGFIEKDRHPLGKGPEVRGGSPMLGGLWLRKDAGSSGRLRGERFLWAPEGQNVAFFLVLIPTSS